MNNQQAVTTVSSDLHIDCCLNKWSILFTYARFYQYGINITFVTLSLTGYYMNNLRPFCLHWLSLDYVYRE